MASQAMKRLKREKVMVAAPQEQFSSLLHSFPSHWHLMDPSPAALKQVSLPCLKVHPRQVSPFSKGKTVELLLVAQPYPVRQRNLS